MALPFSSSSISLDDTLEDSTKLQNLNTLGAILLGIFTIVSFVGNIFLVSTVASSYQLRQSIFNYFLVNLSLVNLIDTSVNLVLSMLYVSTGQWQLGRWACVLNSFFQQLVLIETMLAVVLLSIDRAVALQSISKYEDRLTKLRSIIVIIGCWSIGSIVSFPILIGSTSIWSEPNRYRYFCSNYARNPLGYPISILILCFALPLFLVFLSIGGIFWRMHRERLRRRAMLPERLADYTDFIVDNRRVQKYTELAKYSVIAFTVYLLLQGPYLILNFMGQIRNSWEVRDKLGGGDQLITGDAETAITWLKTLFPVCFPFLTFCLCKDIWRKFKDLICCRRTNIIAANAFSSQLQAAEVAAMAQQAMGYSGQGHQCGQGGQAGYHQGYGHYGLGHGTSMKESDNVVTIVPTSAGIHQIRPGNDRCEYADVPQMASLQNRRRSRDSQLQQRRPTRPTSTLSGGRTSDYDTEDSDTLAAAIDQQENVQYRKNPVKNPTNRLANQTISGGDQAIYRLEIDESQSNQGPATSSNTNANTALNQAIKGAATGPLSPSAVDAIPQDKFDQKSIIDKSIMEESQEWPTIFRPKSVASNGHRQKQVNPGVVPSPEKSGSSSRKPKTATDISKIDQSISEEKRRSSLDEKLKSILQDKPVSDQDLVANDQLISSDKPNADKLISDKNASLSVIRHNHLPPLHIDIGVAGDQISINPSPRKISNSSDKDDNVPKRQSLIISPRRKKSLSVIEKPTDDPSISGLPSINSGRSITETDKDISLSQAQVIRMNSQVSTTTKDTRVFSGVTPTIPKSTPLPNLPYDGNKY